MLSHTSGARMQANELAYLYLGYEKKNLNFFQLFYSNIYYAINQLFSNLYTPLPI